MDELKQAIKNYHDGLLTDKEFWNFVLELGLRELTKIEAADRR